MGATIGVGTIVAAVAFMFILGLMFKVLARSLTDVFGLFILTFGLFYGFRTVLITTGLDTPSPDYLFAGTDINALTIKTILCLVLFLAFFTVGAFMVGLKPARSTGLLFVPHEVPTRRMVAITVTLTLITVVLSLYLMRLYGGFGGLMTAAKIDKDLAGSYYLKTPMFLGALVSMATLLDLRRKRDQPPVVAGLVLACGIFDSVMVFAWGQRSAIAIVVAMAILGTLDRQTPGTRSRAVRSTGRILIAALLIVAVAAGLRVTRDNITSGRVLDAYADGNAWRKASLGVNATYFDASMLAYRDWPELRPYRGGEDFEAGLFGAVPRAVWPGKPQAQTGSWFRQIYEPDIVNGWPTGAPTVWYLNFGFVGLALGGVISGIAVGWMARRRWAGPPTGINTALTFVLCVFVLQLGWSNDTPTRIIAWLAPLSLVLLWVRLPGRRTARTPVGRGSGRPYTRVGSGGRDRMARAATDG